MTAGGFEISCCCVLINVFKILTNIVYFEQELAKLKARGLQQENDLNALRSVVKRQQEELKTSVDNVLNLSGELREKDIEMSQVEEQSLL